MLYEKNSGAMPQNPTEGGYCGNPYINPISYSETFGFST